MMHPLISVLILSSLDPIKNFISLNTYISQNAQVHCEKYYIDPSIPNVVCLNNIEKNRVKFFEILDTIGVEHIHNGDYVIFQKKASK